MATGLGDGKGAPNASLGGGTGKGKGVTRNDDGDAAVSESAAEDGMQDDMDRRGAVVIFACRHMFHRACLMEMRDRGNSDDAQTAGPAPDLECPLET